MQDNKSSPPGIQDRSGQRADLDAVEAIGAVAAAAVAGEQRLKELAGRLPGGDSSNYIAVLCDFLAAEYGWGLADIAGLDDRQMLAFAEQALHRRPQNRQEENQLEARPAGPPPAAESAAPPEENAPPRQLTALQKKIRRAVSGKVLPSKKIAVEVSRSDSYVRKLLPAMVKDRLLVRVKGGYRATR
jgi:hypothetical protein